MRVRPQGEAMALQEELIIFAKREGWKVLAGTPPKSHKERRVEEALKKSGAAAPCRFPSARRLCCRYFSTYFLLVFFLPLDLGRAASLHERWQRKHVWRKAGKNQFEMEVPTKNVLSANVHEHKEGRSQHVRRRAKGM